MSRRASVGAVALAVVVVVVVVLVIGALTGGAGHPPLHPRSHDRLGTSAFVALAEELGADVRIADGLDRDRDWPAGEGPDGPGTDVVVLLEHPPGGRATSALEAWVADGGTLVVVDPASPLTPVVSSDMGTGGTGRAVTGPAGRCDIAALSHLGGRGVDPLHGGVLYRVPGGAAACVASADDRGYIVAEPWGRGTIVSVGGSGMFVNAGLTRGSNAAYVAALVAPRPGTDLLVLAPGGFTDGSDVDGGGGDGDRTPQEEPGGAGGSTGDEVGGGTGPGGGTGGGGARRSDGGGRDDGLLALLPVGVKRLLLQLGVALGLYVAWRARRLGRPVAEPRPVAVAASELVAATGVLLDGARAHEQAGAALRTALQRDLARHVGLTPTTPPATLAEVVAERSGVEAARVLDALAGPPVADDAGLVALARTIDQIRQEVINHARR